MQLVKIPTHARATRAAGAARRRCTCSQRDWQRAAGRDRPLRARHHRRDQRRARAQGRTHRPASPPRASATCWRSAARCGTSSTSSMLEPETPVFLAPGALRSEVPERITATGEVLSPLDESVGRAPRPTTLAAEGVAGDRHRLPVLVPQSGARAARRARSSRDRHPDARGLALVRGRSGVPRIRAHRRHRLRRLREAGDRPLSRRMEQDLAAAGVGAAADHAVARRHLRPRAVARAAPVRLFLSGPAAGVIGGRVVGRAARRSRTSSPSTSAAPAATSR